MTISWCSNSIGISTLEHYKQEAIRVRKEEVAEKQRTWSSIPVKGSWKSVAWGAILGMVFGLLEFAGLKSVK